MLVAAAGTDSKERATNQGARFIAVGTTNLPPYAACGVSMKPIQSMMCFLLCILRGLCADGDEIDPGFGSGKN